MGGASQTEITYFSVLIQLGEMSSGTVCFGNYERRSGMMDNNFLRGILERKAMLWRQSCTKKNRASLASFVCESTGLSTYDLLVHFPHDLHIFMHLCLIPLWDAQGGTDMGLNRQPLHGEALGHGRAK